MAEQIKVVLFDLGKVLVDFNHLRSAERIAYFCAKKPQEIYNMFFESPATIAFEAGKISPEDFYLKIKEALDLKLSFASFVPIWNDIFFLTPNNRAVFGLLNRLRSQYQTAMLSNINTLHYEFLKTNFPVFGVFDQVFLSFELGLIKPDQEIYHKVANVLKVAPEEIFYTDDRPELVESAKSLGFKACVFKDFQQLIHDLAVFKIKFS